MTQHYTAFSPSGQITKNITGTEEDVVRLNLDEGEDIVDGSWNAALYYIKDGAAKPYPPKQFEGQTFDYATEAWVDVRSDAEKSRDLKAAIREAVTQINAAAGRLRSAFLTSIPFQDLIYAEKRTEAEAYLAMDPEPATLEDFPFIESEVGITAPTAYQVAQIYANQAEVNRRIGAMIEKDRLANIRMVEEYATTPEEVWAIANMIVKVFDDFAEEVINGGDGEDE